MGDGFVADIISLKMSMRKLFFVLAVMPFLFAFAEGDLDKPKAMCKQCEQKIKAAKTKAELKKAEDECAKPLLEWAKKNPDVVKAKKKELKTMIGKLAQVYKDKKKQLK